MSKRKSPPEQSELVLSPTTARVIQLSAEIQATPPDDIEFMHTVLCQVGLPRKRTKETRFERNNGKASLLITAGEMYNDGHWGKALRSLWDKAATGALPHQYRSNPDQISHCGGRPDHQRIHEAVEHQPERPIP